MQRAAMVGAALLAVLLVAEVGARIVTRDLPDGWNLQRLSIKVDQIEDLDRIDLVLLGDSTVETGIDPVLLMDRHPDLGSVYNAALPAASPALLELWTREIVLPRSAPRVAVIGITSPALNDAGVWQDLVTRYEESPARLARAGELGLLQRWAGSFALYDHRASLRTPSTWTGLQPVGVGDRGYVAGIAAVDDREAWMAHTRDEVLRDYATGGAQTAALARLIDLLGQQGSQPILVAMPVVEADLVPLHPDGPADYAEFQASLAALATSLDVPVVSPPVGLLGPEAFADAIHLNREGAALFTTWLGDVLDEGPSLAAS